MMECYPVHAVIINQDKVEEYAKSNFKELMHILEKYDASLEDVVQHQEYDGDLLEAALLEYYSEKGHDLDAIDNMVSNIASVIEEKYAATLLEFEKNTGCELSAAIAFPEFTVGAPVEGVFWYTPAKLSEEINNIGGKLNIWKEYEN
jgi:pyridoxal/pyridoxine/pyridoxamine kinase